MGLADSATCPVCVSRVSKGLSHLLRESGKKEGEQNNSILWEVAWVLC